jgi:hypothetical protein
MIKVYGFVDASHGVHSNLKGHTSTGGVISIGSGTVHAKSSKQKINSKSSSETELIGLSDYLSQVVWTQHFLMSQGYELEPATIFQDNTSTMAMVEKGHPVSENTRHIDIRYYFIKDHVERKELQLVYLPTGEMVADILTKPLHTGIFVHRPDCNYYRKGAISPYCNSG